MKNLSPTTRPGFSLIEILVAVSIIAVLLALGGAIWANAQESAQDRTIRLALGQLAGVSTEYTVQTGGVAVAYTGGYSTDPTADTNSIADFVTAVKDNAQPAYEMLITVNEGLKIDNNNDGEPDIINDVWDRPLRYYAGTFNGAGDETGVGLYQRQQPYFASAGPDGAWGTINATTNEPDDQAADNLYSFEID